MCTVIYLPTTDGILLSSNRDESPLRPKASLPKIIEGEDTRMICPLDAQAGGTWSGMNEFGDVIILLNGGFEKHKHIPPYKKSRGLIVRELLSTSFHLNHWEAMDLNGVEPFTLIVWSNNKIHQLVWDGQAKHLILPKLSKPHIWSSSTLYPAAVKQQREALFHQWLETRPNRDAQAVLEFLNSYTDEENGFIMNRQERVKTLSISVIELNPHQMQYSFYDLQANLQETVSFNA